MELQKSMQFLLRFTILTNSIQILYLMFNVLFAKTVFIQKGIIYFILGVAV